MTPQELLFGYAFLLLGVLGAVAVFYEYRRKRFDPTSTEDRIFRCESCAYVYTDDPGVDRSRCPQCGTMNQWIRF